MLQPGEKSFRLVEIRMLARRLKNYMDEHDEAVAYLELVSADDEHVQLVETITGAGTDGCFDRGGNPEYQGLSEGIEVGQLRRGRAQKASVGED